MVTAEHPVPTVAGLHARLAVEMAAVAQRAQSSVVVAFAGEEARATDVMALMRLDVRQGETVRIQAEGPDARQVVDALCLVLDASGEVG